MPDTTSKRFAHVKFGVRTDVGRKRRNNEDAHGEWPAQGVFCVADGMGGAQDGEVASRAVVESLAGLLPRWAAFDPPMAQEDRLDALARALDAASFWVKSYADSQGKKGCGSTFVGVCLDPGDPSKATAVHAGDSRVYRVRGKKIVQITRDHSVAQMAGVKDEKELNPMFRSLILRAVGIKPAVEAERTPFDVAEGDRILVCSDGLSRMVPDKEIARIAEAAESPNAAADALVDRANELGGKDNVTVVAVFVGALPAPGGVRARLTEAEMAALFAAPGGGEGDSTTGVTDGETRSDDTGLTIPKGAGAFDTSSSGEFLLPGGLPPPPETPDDDESEDDDPPPDTDEIPASARLRRRLRGASLAVSHALRTPAGAAIASALAVVLAGGIIVPPAMRAAERRQAEAAARIEAEKAAAEAARLAAEKAAEAARIAEEKAERERKNKALADVREALNEKANAVSNRICGASAPGDLPTGREIDDLFSSGSEALSSCGYTREFFPFAEAEKAWSNRCDGLLAQWRERKDALEKYAAGRIAESKAAAEAAAKVLLADEEKKWNADAEALFGRIEKAASSADASVLGPEVKKLFLSGVAAFEALDEAVRGLPEFSSAVDGWSNRCARLSENCSRWAETLAKEAERIAAEKARAEAEAKAKAEAEAKARAEAEAKARAEAEAKARAKAEAKARAEAEARAKAEAEAKAKKEAESKARAEAEETARLKARADLWRPVAIANSEKEEIDSFLKYAGELQGIISGFKEGKEPASRISAGLSGNDVGSACAVLEDAFSRPSFLWRFAAAPGVARAEWRCGFAADSDPERNLEDIAFALNGIAALAGGNASPDADRWKAFRSLVNSFAFEVIGDAKEPPARDEGLERICAALQGKVPVAPLKEAADCLERSFENWAKSGNPDLAAVARASADRLKEWRRHPQPDDGFALMLAGFETIFCSKEAQDLIKAKKLEEVGQFIDPNPRSVDNYMNLLSAFGHAVKPEETIDR